MGRRWAKPREHAPAGQLALPGFGARTLTERPRIETDHVALGSVDTSREAAAAVETHAAATRRLVLQIVRGAGVRGVTCDEVSAATGRTPNQVSGRFTELARLGLILRSGQRRTTRAGSEAHVWVGRKQ